MDELPLETLLELWELEGALSHEFGGNPFAQQEEVKRQQAAKQQSRREAALSAHFEATTKQLVKNTYDALKTGTNEISINLILPMRLAEEDLLINPDYLNFLHALEEKNITLEKMELRERIHGPSGLLVTREIVFTIEPDLELWSNICYEWNQELQRRRSGPSP